MLLAKVIKSLRGTKLSDYIRTGKTLVPNQLIKGPGTPGAIVTWGIKGGAKIFAMGDMDYLI